jgi:hypothetical protein
MCQHENLGDEAVKRSEVVVHEGVINLEYVTQISGIDVKNASAGDF